MFLSFLGIFEHFYTSQESNCLYEGRRSKANLRLEVLEAEALQGAADVLIDLLNR